MGGGGSDGRRGLMGRGVVMGRRGCDEEEGQRRGGGAVVAVRFPSIVLTKNT